MEEECYSDEERPNSKRSRTDGTVRSCLMMIIIIIIIIIIIVIVIYYYRGETGRKLKRGDYT